MGSGHNESLSVGRGARRSASTRTAVHFWNSVPTYQYELPCGDDHVFRSRTPLTARAHEHADEYVDYEDFVVVWCDRCQKFTVIDDANPEAVSPLVSTDEVVAFEQDKGLIRERIGLALMARGLLTNEKQLADMAVEFGVPVREIRKINAGLVAPISKTDEPVMCQAGKHELTVDNTYVNGQGRRGCKKCKSEAQRERRKARRKTT